MNESALVTIINGTLKARWNDLAEAKLALKELKLLKKQKQLDKKAVMHAQRLLREKYTHDVRERGAKFMGGGSTGRFVRAVQTKMRAGHRANLAIELEPLETKRAELDNFILAIDTAINQVEHKLLTGQRNV